MMNNNNILVILVIACYLIRLFYNNKVKQVNRRMERTREELVNISNWYENYLPLRNIDPSFVIYNTTYVKIPHNWSQTVYENHSYLVNALATKTLKDIQAISNKEVFRCALICTMIINTDNGIKLLLEDPFDYIITQELDISEEDANKAIGKISLVHFHIIKSNEVHLELITLTNINKVIDKNIFIEPAPIYTKIFK